MEKKKSLCAERNVEGRRVHIPARLCWCGDAKQLWVEFTGPCAVQCMPLAPKMLLVWDYVASALQNVQKCCCILNASFGDWGEDVGGGRMWQFCPQTDQCSAAVGYWGLISPTPLPKKSLFKKGEKEWEGEGRGIKGGEKCLPWVYFRTL